MLAIKMFAWWAKVGQYRDNLSADIKYGDIAYIPGTNFNYPAINNAYNIISYYICRSDNASGNKIFSMNYWDGYYNSTGAGTGNINPPINT